MSGRRAQTLVLAGSLGLNVALCAVLIYQAVAAGRGSSRYESDRWRRYGESRGRSDWESRYRAEPDSTRPFPRLDDEQIQRLREMRREITETINPLREEINGLQALMREELGKPEPDLARLDSMVTETSRLQSQIQQHSLRLILREREILTPEQFRSFTRMMVPGQFGDREPDRRRSREPSERDTTRNSHKSSRDPREPPPPPYLYPPH